MRTLTIITPYKSEAQLLQVQRLCYQENDWDSLKSAVTRIQLWQTRGKLPHAVDATAWLLSAMLNDEGYIKAKQTLGRSTKNQINHRILSPLNDFTLRNAYAMALVRFLNGILDPFQQGTFAMALLTIAKDIGFPYAFVEIRHWATHEQLPSLELLRATSKSALQWLEQNFWVPLSERLEMGPPTKRDAFSSVSEQDVLLCLKTYKILAKKRMNNQPLLASHATDEMHAINDLKDIADDETHSHRLVHLMALQKVLFRGKSFGVSRDLYAPLLARFPPRLNLQVAFFLLLKLQYSQKAVGGDVDSEGLERELIENWLAFLIPEILRGPFPFKVYHQTFTCKEDVARSLQNHRLACGYRSVSPPSIRPKIETGCRKQKVARALLLEEVLNSTTESVLQRKTGEPDDESFTFMSRKKPKASLIFSRDASWKPAPFGVLPSSNA
ncbi:ribosomal biogenesis protein LAS1 [Metschnikowia aff. pulcherrima]|uniref:Ribosomal biogenesis protein LAS1 n=1 Tax=Metschnikowia aff. pulcherrima TaxID=2163413 RepID=A0A4P6XLN8_9ASCO|nr:ribosomal biogenesis protein LAS1 [Metschnikowia aff. pulcherrima]